MKRILLMITSILVINMLQTSTGLQAQSKSFYDFTVKTITGEDFPLSSLKGKKVLVVNVASKCGFTPQYAQLEEIYKKYGPDKFVIIGFPANNFMRQEPGTNEEIQEFCQINYGVTFPMMGKISVRGKDIDPLYKWLTEKSENGVENSKVTWNFQKYMINENGQLVGHVAPKTTPTAQEIIDWIELNEE